MRDKPTIVRRRDVQQGQPVISNTRLPVQQMREAYDAAGRRYLAEQYDMTPREINAALGHRWRYWWLRSLEYMAVPLERSRWFVVYLSICIFIGMFIGMFVVSRVIGWVL